MTRYLYDCLYCGYPTKHPSHTCPAHRDLAPPIVGLDVPYPETVELEAVDDLVATDPRGVDRRKRPDPAARPARPLDR